MPRLTINEAAYETMVTLLREGGRTPEVLARKAGVSLRTAYRYLREVDKREKESGAMLVRVRNETLGRWVYVLVSPGKTAAPTV